jgi:hypothetical protein
MSVNFRTSSPPGVKETVRNTETQDSPIVTTDMDATGYARPTILFLDYDADMRCHVSARAVAVESSGDSPHSTMG